MKKSFVSFAFVLALLFCGCSDSVSYKEHNPSVPNSTQVDQSIKVQRVEIPTSEVAALEDTSEVDPADDSLQSEEETTMDSAQVPVYSVEEETASDMEDGTTPDTGESEAQPSSAEEEEDSTVPLPQDSVDTLEEQKAFPCEINTYVMHTVYQTETGEDMLDLCIQMPVIEPEVFESEQLFNHYISEKSIAYALYVQETVCPELQAQWENTEDESHTPVLCQQRIHISRRILVWFIQITKQTGKSRIGQSHRKRTSIRRSQRKALLSFVEITYISSHQICKFKLHFPCRFEYLKIVVHNRIILLLLLILKLSCVLCQKYSYNPERFPLCFQTILVIFPTDYNYVSEGRSQWLKRLFILSFI